MNIDEVGCIVPLNCSTLKTPIQYFIVSQRRILRRTLRRVFKGEPYECETWVGGTTLSNSVYLSVSRDIGKPPPYSFLKPRHKNFSYNTFHDTTRTKRNAHE